MKLISINESLDYKTFQVCLPSSMTLKIKKSICLDLLSQLSTTLHNALYHGEDLPKYMQDFEDFDTLVYYLEEIIASAPLGEAILSLQSLNVMYHLTNERLNHIKNKQEEEGYYDPEVYSKMRKRLKTFKTQLIEMIFDGNPLQTIFDDPRNKEE